MSFKPIDTSKEEFRAYLAKAGVLDSLTKVLMKCYKDRQEDPIRFIKENISITLKKKAVIQEWKEKISAVDAEIADLEAELEREKAKLHQEQMQRKE